MYFVHGMEWCKRVVLNQSKSDSVRFFPCSFLTTVQLLPDVVGCYSLPHSSILLFILDTIISHSIDRTCSEPKAGHRAGLEMWKPQRQKRDDTHEDCRSELAGNCIPCMPGVHMGKILRIAVIGPASRRPCCAIPMCPVSQSSSISHQGCFWSCDAT